MAGTAAPAPEGAFVISHRFDAPRPRLWSAWTEPDQLSRWFGPRGVTTTLLRHELRPGGLVHARMERPEGGPIWARFLYREVLAPQRLVWEHSFADERGEVARAPFFDGVWPLRMLTTVTFAEEGAATGVTLTWSPLDATEAERRSFAGNTASMTQGWSGSFATLEAYLAAG
jgi:uncharacterized protein YndB with AHSA1/START domain